MSYHAAMPHSESVTYVIAPAVALQYAISLFPVQAEFVRKLAEASGRPVKSAHVANWLRRGHRGERGDGCGRGVSEEFAPSVEAITGVPCEVLRPNVNWAQVRNREKPEVPAALYEFARQH